MLFSAKSKGYFVEQNDNVIRLARTSAPAAPFVVEEVRECIPDNAAALTAAITQLLPRKSSSGYLHASCGVYPQRRFLRRVTLDPKRLKGPGYFEEILTQQLRVEPAKFVTMVLNAQDGTDFDASKGATQKEVLFGGLPSEEIIATQDALLAKGVYPERLEYGSISTLGGLVNYLSFIKSKTPTLVLEIGLDATNTFIVGSAGVEATRPIPQGLESMIPVVQKELGLKDEESARKLFYSNTFDFTGMGPLLIRKLLKELQSSIGFYEVQTGQSVGLLLSTMLPTKLDWLDSTIAKELGISPLKLDSEPWLGSYGITVAEAAKPVLNAHWFGLLALMARYETATPVAHVVVAEKV
jgi:hypothetical protein